MKHKLILFTSLLLTLSGTQAPAQLPPSDIADTAETAVRRPIALSNPAHGLGPSVVVKLEKSLTIMEIDGDSSYCSAFPITRDGYMLTALHCVRSCLSAQNAMEDSANSYLGLEELNVSKNPRNTNTVCSTYAISALKATSVKVLATGSALSLYSSDFLNLNTGYFNALKAKNWHSKANDFALIKVETAAPLECLKLRSAPPSPGEKIWAIGFPVQSKREDKAVLSASPGRVYQSPTQSIKYKSMTTAEDRNWVATQFSGPDLAFSSAANYFGQSGGAVVAADGTVVGVVSGYASTVGPNREEIHEMISPTTQTILKGLPNAVAAALLEKNKECR